MFPRPFENAETMRFLPPTLSNQEDPLYLPFVDPSTPRPSLKFQVQQEENKTK